MNTELAEALHARADLEPDPEAAHAVVDRFLAAKAASEKYAGVTVEPTDR